MWEYIIGQLKKMTEVAAVYVILIFVTWITLYNLTDAATVTNYFWIGVGVCVLNALVYNLSKLKIKSVFMVKGNWVIMAGVVLVLHHAGFSAAAVCVAAAIFASPFFCASIYEGVVGLTLLIALARLI